MKTTATAEKKRLAQDAAARRNLIRAPVPAMVPTLDLRCGITSHAYGIRKYSSS
jgi:hypothetical protein